MSGGTKPHQLRYYKEMTDGVRKYCEQIDLAHPGAAEQIKEVVRRATQDLITTATISPEIKGDIRDVTVQERMRNDTWGALHELLLDVEGGNGQILSAAEAKARELGITDPVLLRTVGEMARAFSDLMVTMERDHWEISVEIDRDGTGF